MTDFDQSGSAWLSQGFERLVDRVRKAPNAQHFDVLIVGSGYGGAIAAATFAGRRHGGTGAPVTVGVLERGREYLPGSFPTGLGELPRHVRREHNKEGLFDIRLGEEVTTVVANGVGGGSLINAGVMEEASHYVFAANWPSHSSTHDEWKDFYGRAREMLGAGDQGKPLNTIEPHLPLPPKYAAIKAVGGGKFRPAALTVALQDGTSFGNVKLNKCNRCGDCATGCNFGAKISLDTNLLVKAQQAGAEIFTGATVLDVREKPGAGWLVRCVYTSSTLRARDGQPVEILARRLVLAAGTLGSTEILLRSAAKGLPLSAAQLGKRCSANGDMLIADYATANDVHTVADGAVKPSARGIGPTITGVIDLRDEPERLLIEEMSVPAGLRLAFTEIFATVNTLHSLADRDGDAHVKGFPNDDIYAVPAEKIERSALYAVMGDDGAAGTIDLGEDPVTDAADGIAQMRWKSVPVLPDVALFDRQVEVLEGLTEAANTGGRLIPNPVWKLLPEDLQWLLDGKRGPLTTVHPLGGCAMAEDGASGVVNEHGEVFSTGLSSAVHDGLAVLDGSVIPTALGTNPALTISAVALRGAEALADKWGFIGGGAAAAAAVPFERPVYRHTDEAAPPPATQVEFIERLAGPVKFKPQGEPRETWIVELTLRFAPKPLAELSRPPSDGGNPVLQVATDQSELTRRSRIRIFTVDDWKTLQRSWDPAEIREQQQEALAKFSAPLRGSLKIFERQSSIPVLRTVRAGAAWYANRGARDIYQADPDVDHGPSFWERFRSGLALASRAGEKRALEYDLTIGPKSASSTLTLNGNKIVGVKTFTYERRANPWRQLMEVSLDDFPGLGGFTDVRVLELDSQYLARIGVPLLRIARQQDSVGALAELIAFFGYVLRLLLGIHVWSFRQPDKWTETGNDTRILPEIDLPGMPGEYVPVTVPKIVPDFGDGTEQQGTVLLTHYEPAAVTQPRPVVMFHGYSAGGTTFSHHAVDKSFARYLYDLGYDVWVADLRTSSGHPESAKMGWSYDQVGAEDVPAIVDKVLAATGKAQVDVVAHCMGAIVFGMAALGGKIDGKVNRAAFTQVAPLVVFSPANVIRAYLLRYLVEFLPDDYSFNPKEPTLADDLLDRVLATLPYPAEEFDLENPPWFANRKERTPWTRTRHRMDALYGRDFSLVHMDKNLLRYIDEHFANVHLRTVTQALHFVRWSMMTDHRGRNAYLSRAKLASASWNFPTFSVHGTDNGLSHVATMDRMAKILDDAGRTYRTPFYNEGAGHQDALIGGTRLPTFGKVAEFLANTTVSANAGAADTEITAYPPWLGPVITEERPNTPLLVIRVGSMPSHREVEAALMLRVTVLGEQIQRPDLQPWDAAYIADHAAAYISPRLRKEGWDAFEVPAPTSFPGYSPGDPLGNGVLVLLTYAEDESLPAMLALRGHIYQQHGVLWAGSWVRGNSPVRFGGQAELARFGKMVTGALKAIQLSLAPQSTVRLAEPQLKLIGMRRQTVREIAAAGAGTISTAPMTTAALTFGVDTPTGVAAMKALVEDDRHLTDGVIPYDPPAASAPAPSPGGTSFALASCQYPAGLIDGRVAYRGYERINARLDAGTGTAIVPRFLVFAGDQVYVDPTAGLYDPTSADDRYRRPYEDWLGDVSVRNALRRIPSFMLLDDHEIGDNWEPPDDNDFATGGVAAYEKYQRGLHPALNQFDFDGFRFFLLNTRTDRAARKVGGPAATLFQGGQMAALKGWLQNEPGPKFVVSSSMLLPRHRRAIQNDARLAADNFGALHSDGWDGYPATLLELLGFIAENGISQVVFLSGDEHRGCIASVELRDSSGTALARVHSIHTAAMYAPFPFANSLDDDVVPNESFDVPFNGKTYTCVVSTLRPAAGDGPTFLRVRNDFGTWRLDYEFADGAVQTVAV